MASNQTEPPAPALHHVAFACRDLEETRHFYEDVLGFPLVYTEVTERGPSTLTHTFHDIGDGSAIAFFHLVNAGEPEPLRTAISTDLDLPVWVNHVAVRASRPQVEEVSARLDEHDLSWEMVLDHDWCHSSYVVDPNGILVEFCVDTPGMTPDPAQARALLEEQSG